MRTNVQIKNILLIGVDQMRWDVLGPHKSVPVATPSLDALVSQGVWFRRAYATCPLCSPARASMFTGDYAFTHGMGTNCDMYHSLAAELPDPRRLLHHDLLTAGFRCGYLGKWHIGTQKGPGAFGFEGLDLPGYGNVTASADFKQYLLDRDLSYAVEPTLYFNPNQQTMAGGRWRGSARSTSAHYLTSRTIDMLGDYAAGKHPFFITVQYWDPHGPHLVSDEFYGLTDRSRIEAWSNFDDDLSGKPRRVRRERDDFYRLHPREESELIEYIGLYCDHISMLDQEIGRLMAYLEDSGLAENTLVIFTSDHGDMTGAHGGLIDKGLLYEEALRVPLVFAHPSLQPGERDGLALNMDILPTAFDLAGVTFTPRQAASLVSQIENRDSPSRPYLLCEYHGLRFLYSQRCLISDDGWKLIFTPGDYDELYDLNNDPGERWNLVDDRTTADILARMRQALIEQTALFDDPLRDCVAKFNGQWRTGSQQFDATSAYLGAP